MLGGLEVARAGAPVAGLVSRKGAALLAYLAVSRRAHFRASLAGLLWGESPEDAARGSLRHVLMSLRAVLGPDVLVGRELVAFNRSRPYLLDAERFEALVVPGTEVGDESPADRARHLREAVGLYRGDFLEGVVLPDAPAFDEWQAAQRERLRHLAAQALQALAAHDAAAGRTLAAVDGLTRLLALDPWREEAHRELMRLLAAAGQRGAALAQFETCRRVLQEAMDTDPEPATVALAEAIRHGTAGTTPEALGSLAWPPFPPAEALEAILATGRPGRAPSQSPQPPLPPEQARTRPRGQRRSSLGRAARPAPGRSQAPPEPAAPVHNLPETLTPLVGRTDDLGQVGRRLARSRLVTLTGPGGVGKTRLALAVARELAARYPHGTWLVELAPLTEPALVPVAVGNALGIRVAGGLDPATALAAALRPRRTLLVLDNCEHLRDACAALVATLLAACPALSVLATSRALLGVAGEAVWRVPPLRLPPVVAGIAPADVAASEAVQLFCARAADVAPSFRLSQETAPAVAAVCRRLEGLPLALELAAARLRALPLAELSARLAAAVDDAPGAAPPAEPDSPPPAVGDALRLLRDDGRRLAPRHRTLRATVEWSLDLLDAPAGALLRRLAVFAGGWTLDAAEAVCAGPDLPRGVVVDALQRLVDESLVQLEVDAGGGGRYRLLEPVRQVVWARLRAVGEAEAVRLRHALWCLVLLRRAGPALREGPRVAGAPEAATQRAWLSRLDGEQANLRAALAWATARRPGLALHLAGSLWPYWRNRGQTAEGRRRLEAALDGDRRPTRTRALALVGAGVLAFWDGDPPASAVWLEAGLRLAEERGDARTTAAALRSLASLRLTRGEYAAAERDAAAALAVAEAAGAGNLVGGTREYLAHLRLLQGDLQGGWALVQQCLAEQRSAGDPWTLANALSLAGQVALARGEDARAAAHFTESLAVAEEIGAPWHVAAALWQLGNLALWRGGAQEAAARYDAGLELARAHGSDNWAIPNLIGLGRATALLGDPDRATALLAAARDRAVDLGRRPDEAAALHGLGRAAHAAGDAAGAAAYLRASLALHLEFGERLAVVEDLEALARAGAGDEETAAARWLAAATAERRRLGAPLPARERESLDGMTRPAEGAAPGPAGGTPPGFEQAVAEALASSPDPPSGARDRSGGETSGGVEHPPAALVRTRDGLAP